MEWFVDVRWRVWRSLSCFMFHAFWNRFCGDSIYFEVLISTFGWIFLSWPDNWLDLNHNLNMNCFALNSVGSSQEFCEEWKRFLAMKPVGKVSRKDSTKLSTLKKVIMNSEWHFYILGFKTLRSTQNLLYWTSPTETQSWPVVSNWRSCAIASNQCNVSDWSDEVSPDLLHSSSECFHLFSS